MGCMHMPVHVVLIGNPYYVRSEILGASLVKMQHDHKTKSYRNIYIYILIDVNLLWHTGWSNFYTVKDNLIFDATWIFGFCLLHICGLLAGLILGLRPARADSRLAPSQWEMPLQSNAISHWLPGANLESALCMGISLCQPVQDHYDELEYVQINDI